MKDAGYKKRFNVLAGMPWWTEIGQASKEALGSASTEASAARVVS